MDNFAPPKKQLVSIMDNRRFRKFNESFQMPVFSPHLAECAFSSQRLGALEEMEGWRGSLPIAAPPFFKLVARHVREEILRL